MLKLVPFNEAWVSHERLDIHAIYRRPRYREDEYGGLVQERGPDGQPLWDLTAPLPVRQHNRWRAKGFEYVTLANHEGQGGAIKHVADAHRAGTIPGRVKDYANCPRTGGPWNLKMYLDGLKATDDEAVEQLKADIAEFGWQTVEKLRRRTDPHFSVPDALKGDVKADQKPSRREAVRA